MALCKQALDVFSWETGSLYEKMLKTLGFFDFVKIKKINSIKQDQFFRSRVSIQPMSLRKATFLRTTLRQRDLWHASI